MSITRTRLTSAIALLSCSLAIGGAANAAMLRLDFTATFDELEGFDHSLGNLVTFPANITMSGTVTWDSTISPYASNGVNSRSWEYASFEAVVEGGFVGFGSIPRDVGITASTPAAPGGLNHIQGVHRPGNGSELYWKNSNWATPPGFASGAFEINTFEVAAMPLFASPLPSDPGDYYGDIPFNIRYDLIDFGFNSEYSIRNPAISSFVVTKVPAPGAASLLGLSGIIAMRRKR